LMNLNINKKIKILHGDFLACFSCSKTRSYRFLTG